MDKVNLLIYSYPKDPKYSVVSDYDGGIIADYEAEITKQFPTIGDTRTYPHHLWQDEQCKLIPARWIVAQVSPCDRLSLVQLTLDGQPTELEDMDPEQLLQIIVSPERIRLSWPTQPEYGITADEAIRIESFHPDKCWQIQVCWCAPATSTEPTLAQVA